MSLQRSKHKRGRLRSQNPSLLPVVLKAFLSSELQQQYRFLHDCTDTTVSMVMSASEL